MNYIFCMHITFQYIVHALCIPQYTGCPKSQVPNLHTRKTIENETNESTYSALHVINMSYNVQNAVHVRWGINSPFQ